ncbi:ABC transporter ATP-binding protein [Bacillus atrophaeus]|uniref:Thiamine ABC transporter ATP-binding protein n=1 Tax=Bacillus atrophaeus (strain 1942) TaxID=720555 RepID=A0ABN3Z7K2_BACA1|nr:ABC transporter ATP-binding protein [Bacillus atrophaeus]AMR63251.1 cobalt ABC transporter [Bacillus subtilis subsp. globigii]ADP31820.1 thiamine ABC transporter ATP-binding protein [Bacillus atrophaeus 1942]AIK46051.1 heme ABC exporter, ATP-binding protein CcmA [Bacillus atrophaeus subsp. globigii]EIM10471.1 thiamine ABC transporter ATP-binding protein [Bacillus atrophaeus C89]KFK83396.1 heme ABC exporter, ATP-binding protein CcmA [Bacillus atrophaeus]
MQDSNELLSIDRLTFSYEEDEKPIFKDLSFQIQKGERALLLGPSGCGKSSLALCINGLYPEACDAAQTGRISLFQKNIEDFQAAEKPSLHIGVVFQDPDQQFCMLTVEDEIAFGLENLQMPKEEMKERIDDVLVKLDLTGLKGQTISALSGGTKQKVALACILAMEPDLIILDEPTSLLDPHSARSFVHMIKELQEEKGFGLLVIEHQLDEWAPWVERTIVLDASGQKVMDGETPDIFQFRSEELKKIGVAIPHVAAMQENLNVPFTLSKEMLFTQPFPAFEEGKNLPLTEDVLEVNGLSFSRGQRAIFSDISFSLRAGSLTAVVGPNGTGKSTLLSVLARLYKPKSGEIRLFGKPLHSFSENELRRQMGFVFQNPEHQFVADTVFGELVFGHKHQKDAAEKAHDLLRRFGLDHVLTHHPFALSQGQKRRLSVATMMMHDLKILLLDEPTFGQDAKTAAECMELIESIQAAGTAVLMITHDMELVSAFADNVLVLHDTKLVYQGAPAPLFSEQNEIVQQAKLAWPLQYEWLHHKQQEEHHEPAITNH